jgi:hypothetical protein
MHFHRIHLPATLDKQQYPNRSGASTANSGYTYEGYYKCYNNPPSAALETRKSLFMNACVCEQFVPNSPTPSPHAT